MASYQDQSADKFNAQQILENEQRIKIYRLLKDKTSFSNLSEEEKVSVESILGVERTKMIELENSGNTALNSIINAKVAEEYGNSQGITKTANASASAVTTPNPVIPPPTNSLDPKDYVVAPFHYNYKNHESVSLNSGALTYRVTDFVLPGKNGFDLVVERIYDSSKSNTEDAGFNPHRERAYSYAIYKRYGVYERGYLIDDYYGSTALEIGEVFVNSGERNTTMNKAKNLYKDYEETVQWDATLTAKITVEAISISQDMVYYTTEKRTNDHLKNAFGLGYGWSFNFPSIETLPSGYTKKNGISYSDFLHLGDGRVYKIDTLKPSGMKDYDLADIRLQKMTGTSPAEYDYILHLKDGKKQFIKNGYLTATQDRFGNTIYFTFFGNGNITITDTVGRTIRLQLDATGSKRIWSLPDNQSVEYSVNSYDLVQVKDQVGRITKYQYSSDTAMVRLYSQTCDINAVSILYRTLNMIIHPTQSRSNFVYHKKEEVYNNPKESYSYPVDYGRIREYYVLESRFDSISLNNSKTFNLENYSYFTSNYEKKDGSNKYRAFYISVTTFVRPDSGAVIRYIFDKDGLCQNEVRIHNSLDVLHKEFQYTNKLLTQETTSYPLQKTQTWTYDSQANITSHTDEMQNTVTMTYDSLYSIMLSKQYPRETSTSIIEEYTLGNGGKSITWKKIFELLGSTKTLKEATEYRYAQNNVVEEKRYYGNLQTLNTFHSMYIDYANTNAALSANYANLFPTTKIVSGVADNSGQTVDVVEVSKYDAYGRIIEKTDANGNTAKWQFDAIGRVLREEYPSVSGVTAAKTTLYDDRNNRISITDENGHTIRYDYMPLGLIDSVYNAASGTMLRSYDYDSLSRLEKETVYEENATQRNTTVYNYDSWDRITRKRELNERNTSIYQEDIVYEDSYLSTYTRETKTVYNNPQIKTSIWKDKLGRIVRQCYYLNGAEYYDEFTYDFIGNKTSFQTALDRSKNSATKTTRWVYDHAGRIVRETNALGQYLETGYDYLGNKVWTRDYKGRQTDYSYDALGRLIRQVSPFNGGSKAETQYYYDAAGNLVRQKVLCASDEWRESEYAYDARNRQTQVTLYEDAGKTKFSRTRYEYDKAGKKTNIHTGLTQNSGDTAATTICTYDRFGNVLTMKDPLSQTERHVYDNTGRLISKTDRNGNKTTYGFDSLNRLINESVTAEGRINERTTAYTEIGQKANESETEKIGMTSWPLTISYQYDSMGRVIQQTDPNGIVKTYTYDLGGNRTGFVLKKDGTTEISLAYEYDALNRLIRVKNARSANAVIVSYSYDENGNRQTLTYLNGVKTRYEYNDANLVTLLENSRNGNVSSRWSYTYRLDGNQTAKTDKNGRTTTYAYDRLGRLTRESDPAWNTIAYEYDRFGNRSKMETTGAVKYTTTYLYDRNNRLTSEEKREEGVRENVRYHYDKNGNQTVREWEMSKPASVSNIFTASFTTPETHGKNTALDLRTYDGMNRQVEVYRDGEKTRYQYRPDGLWDCKATEAAYSDQYVSRTYHHWDGQNIVMETTNNASVKGRYLRGMDLICQQIDANDHYYLFNAQASYAETPENEIMVSTGQDTTAQQVSAGSLEYYIFNGHGDVTGLTDASGNLIKSYDYDAWGLEKNPDPNDTNVFRYCSEMYDKETDTYYLRNRHMNPRIGRFTQEDIARAGLNWYTYCGNNPLSFIDPLGLDAILVNKRIDNAPWSGIDHMGSFFQDRDKNWWFYFFGDQVKYVEVNDNSIFESMDKMNEWLINYRDPKDKDFRLLTPDNPYHSSTYVKGDFTASHEGALMALETYKTELSDVLSGKLPTGTFGVPNSHYDGLVNNCGHNTMELFYKGALPDGTNVGDYINQRGYFSTSVLPNNNLSLMQDVFYNKAFNINGFNAAMQTQRNKYEGKGLLTQLFWLGLRANVERMN